ncbi:MAG: hypothetical protein A2W36_06120 [Chloroflexi bacterium RBG_16_58_14]|nr:MAG: hypothetical protein A2W36_06120 [Chloroflexi bacterium RBG_16_58_14]
MELNAKPSEAGFEILAISAGVAKGWDLHFSADLLKNTMPLFEGAPVFVDHPRTMFHSASVRDLCGTLHSPAWNELEQGIQLGLRPSGPSADVLMAIRDAAKDDPDVMKAIGFSCVLQAKVEKKHVVRIDSIKSVDVVVNPARGGKFLSASIGGTMKKKTEAAVEELEFEEDIEPGRDGAELPPPDTTALMLSMCKAVLNASLTNSKLPGPSQRVIRAHFEGRTFEPEELEKAIEDKRKEIAELSEASLIRGPARVGGMVTTDDQIVVAAHDLFGVERPAELKDVKPARLTGIRELYFLLTGDYELRGGYHPDEMRLATTTDFSGLVANVLNKVVQKKWDELDQAGYGWWKQVCRIEHFNSLNDLKGIVVGTVGTLPEVEEQGEYTELPIGDISETASFTKYGVSLPITLEAIDRDETRKLRIMPEELAAGAMRTISYYVSYIFTQSSGIGPTMGDTGALFNATAVTTAGGHANLGTTALAAAEWQVVRAAMFKQARLIKQAAGYYGTGPRMGIGPKFCLIPVDLEKTARDIFINEWDVTDNKHAQNLLKGSGVPVVVPEFTDANDWAAVADPAVLPCIIVGERFGITPEIFVAGRETDPAVFMNDEHRIKVRIFNAILVQDYRGLYKENV